MFLLYIWRINRQNKLLEESVRNLMLNIKLTDLRYVDFVQHQTRRRNPTEDIQVTGLSPFYTTLAIIHQLMTVELHLLVSPNRCYIQCLNSLHILLCKKIAVCD